MSDSFTETTSQGWGSRIMGSIKSVLFGVLLFFAAFIVLWWNEGRAIKTAKGLEEGASQVVSVLAENPDPAHDGKLVHVAGLVTTNEELTDDVFGINVTSLKLRRDVEMYQWLERKETKTEKKTGGSEETTTTYNYEKGWSNSLVSSSTFKKPEGHTNPASMTYQALRKETSKATLGKFNIPKSILGQINNYTAFDLTNIDTTQIKGGQIVDGSNGVRIGYIGVGTPAAPQIGDARISFQIVQPGEYSIVAKQIKNTFESYKTSVGTNLELVDSGIVSADKMFTSAQEANTMMTWILRFVGFFMMFFGLSMIFKPLVVIADVLPFLGSILGFGVSLFSGIISFCFSFVTIAIAWIFYRPLIGITLLLIGVGIFVFFYMKAAKKKAG